MLTSGSCPYHEGFCLKIKFKQVFVLLDLLFLKMKMFEIFASERFVVLFNIGDNEDV